MRGAIKIKILQFQMRLGGQLGMQIEQTQTAAKFATGQKTKR